MTRTLCAALLALLLSAASFLGGELSIPAGTRLHVRLLDPVSSAKSRPGDQLRAVVIAPVLIGDATMLEAGHSVFLTVKSVQPSAPDRRAELAIEFSLPARLRQIDNARESVDSSGKIVGILAAETLSAQIDRGLEVLGKEWAELAGILETAKALLIKEADPEISYSPGVEMVLELTDPMEASNPGMSRETDSPMNSELERLARSQPLRTMALRPSLPADFINLMFIGTRQGIEKAFSEAGWTRASALKPDSVLETARAIIESRGYHEAPVSTLLLEGRPPDLVFQKMNNTFAKRHHLRIWQRPDTYGGAAVWVAAATHDVGISFAPDSRTFFHTIDPNVDAERSKVVNDLLFTGNVSLLGLAGRPGIPPESTNATGDRMITDGRLAILSIPERN